MKDIIGYEGLYAITSCGRVYSYKSKKFLKPQKNTKNYLFVTLYKSGKPKSFFVHRLVAEAYIENPNNLETVDHIDSNKSNNSINNLQWLSSEDNVRKANSKKVYCVELDKVFNSAREIERELGLYNQGISLCCLGKQKTCGNLHFKFYEEGDINAKC